MNAHSIIRFTSVLLTLLLIPPSNLYSQNVEFDATSSYRARNLHGWTVYIQKRLLREKRDSGARAYAIVADQLSRLTRIIPAQQLKQLKRIPIWICDRSDGPIHYHPQREWLIQNGYNPDKAKAVDISQVNNILRSENTQPSVMLHELAHAYHDQVLGFDNPEVIAAYKKAVKSGVYESVLGIRGQQIRHYALTNEKEYFAECTEAFFATNDFYPFVRAELKQFDPGMYQTLVKAWGIDPNKR
ncbi:MAG: metallopeptidase [Planctomycetaceae bacterium]|nr:metallopeptidase [Planctomycetaceae bacterium]